MTNKNNGANLGFENKLWTAADKRLRFTYETEEEVKQRHANTSLQRAKEFLNEIEKIILK